MIRRAFPRRALSVWRGSLLAFGVVTIAWLARSALDPVLRDQMPYTLFLMGVLLASIFGGWKAGAAATALSALAANFSFVSPRGILHFESTSGWGVVIFVLVSIIQISLVYALADTLEGETAAREELTTVNSEYRHRIKNLLAVTQSLVDQTARAAGSMSEFRDKVSDRLYALARAQDLLHTGKVQAAALHGLIDEILKPFDIDARLVRPINGPDVRVPAEVTTALALLLNELATNAVKYGALSVPCGRLKIVWSVDRDWAVIEWKEMDGPHVAPPETLGFGTRLFANALPSGSGSTELLFEPDGLRCEIKLRTAGFGGN